MISFIFRLLLGVVLVILPFSLFIKQVAEPIKQCIEILIPKSYSPRTRKLFQQFITVVFIILAEYIGMWGIIANLVVPGDMLRVEKTEKDLFKAIDKVKDHLMRSIRRHKRKMIDRRRKGK